MPLSWNEIRARATTFAADWQGTESEDAEAKPFWDAFFEVFGVSRRKVASFEKRVHKLGTAQGKIDLLWKGTLLIEHKSLGRDLTKAYKQAIDYFPGLKPEDWSGMLENRACRRARCACGHTRASVARVCPQASCDTQ